MRECLLLVDAGLVLAESKTEEDSVEMEPEQSQARPTTLAKLANKLSGSGLGDSLNLPIPG